ncbi:MAG: D-aminoacylase [bacterium]
MFDLKIIDGMILDGTGGPARRADIGITGDRIRAIGALEKAEAKAVIEAKGRMVCPGFIDVHSHSDAYLLIEPTAPSKVYQGVTTEVVGNCGASAAPCLGAAHLASDWQLHTYPGRWQTMAEYRRLLETVKPVLNVVPLVGHNVLRASVMGYQGRAATDDEVKAMERLLEQSLDEGGRGLSSGLIYPPGMYAAREEIIRLAEVVQRKGGIYTSHMRSESSRLIEALHETIDVGRATGVRIQVSHLKTSGQGNWHLIDAALETIESARRAGLAVAADRYPYISSCTELDVIFPDWATEGGREAELARLQDPGIRARLRAELLSNRAERSWGSITIGSTTEANSQYRGLPLVEVAGLLKMEPVDAALYLIETDRLMTSAFFQGMSEDNLWRILDQPWVMIGSDASLRAPSGPLSRDYPHPRAYGSFPKFLRAALDGRTVALPEAVRKMTSLPAAQFRLEARGELREGYLADVTVFDPGSLRDCATFSDPHRFSEGITHLVVNGQIVLAEGHLTAVRPGAWL